jgi:hypothetical protein
MNAAQQVVLNELIQAGVSCLWMNSAYVGSYGDLANAQIRKYLEKWGSNKRENSTGQARGIGGGNYKCGSSGEREAPRDKPVASTSR